ncbi:MAG TPA: hypothetical protein VGQ81_04650 [Acidobacteriota bacterium]|nr:hypothetical protein [Acidobacteriota bacterium]
MGSKTVDVYVHDYDHDHVVVNVEPRGGIKNCSRGREASVSGFHLRNEPRSGERTCADS